MTTGAVRARMTAGRPVGRPPVRPRAPVPPHPVPAPPQTLKIVIIGGLIGALALVGIGIIYAFGSAGLDLSTVRDHPRGMVDVPEPPSGSTRIYRDLRNGKVLVLEIDDGGTRVVGTMDKEDVPMAGNMYRDQRARGLDSTMRLNAFSKTFK